MTIRLFIEKPKPAVEAIQFLGWQNAFEIFQWLKGNSFYVPNDAENNLRTKSEFDRSNGHVLGDAPDFLVIQVNGESKRVDRLMWIVKDRDSILIYSDASFKRLYEQN